MSQKGSNPWIRCLSELNILLFICILSLNQVVAQHQQKDAVPQQQQQVVVQQGVPQQQQVHSCQQGQQQFQYQQVPQYQQQLQLGTNVLHDTQRIHDKQQLKEHLHCAIGSDDLSKMSVEEVQFHYFKMYESDNNNKLDGSQLSISLILWLCISLSVLFFIALHFMSQKGSNYRRDSFSDRVCDDLSEVILQFLPIKDKFRFECVDKQFQRTIYQRHHELIITEDMRQRSDTYFVKTLYFNPGIDINIFETILQKLPHIRSLSATHSVRHSVRHSVTQINIPLNDSVIDLIIKYCNHMNEFNASLEGVSDTSKQLFADRFGSQLTSLRVDLSYKSIMKSLVNIQRIKFSNYSAFTNIMPSIITKNLKKVKLCSCFSSQFKDDFDCLKSVTNLWISYDKPLKIVRFVSQLNQLISLDVYLSDGLYKSVNNYLNHFALNCLKLKELNLHLVIWKINDLKTIDFMSEIMKFKSLKRFSIAIFDPDFYLEPKFEDYFKKSVKSGFQNLTL